MRYIFETHLNVYTMLDNNDFSILWEAAKNHYDSTVRATIEVGGYLYGAKQSSKHNPDHTEVKFDAYTLGIAFKSLETHSGGLVLADTLISILQALKEEEKKINSNFKVMTIETPRK